MIVSKHMTGSEKKIQQLKKFELHFLSWPHSLIAELLEISGLEKSKFVEYERA